MLPKLEAIACGVIRTEKSSKKVQLRASEDNIGRAQSILTSLTVIQSTHKCHAIATESMSWPRNAGVVAKMGIVWGVLASFAFSTGMPMIQSSPMEIKRKVCGDGKASKEHMIAAVREIFPNLEFPSQETLHEHAADAVGAVVAARDSEVFKWLMVRV